MFSRAELIPESNRFTEYYKEKPENLKKDTKFRTNPGLLQTGTSKYNPILFALADASFYTVESFKNRVDGKIAQEKVSVSDKEITKFIKNFMLFSGAEACGITELKKQHFSIRGRGEAYGKPVINTHKFAVAIIAQMDKGMTPNLCPRVRIAVVTTNLKLINDKP